MIRYALRTKKTGTPAAPANSTRCQNIDGVGREWCTKTSENARKRKMSSSGRGKNG